MVFSLLTALLIIGGVFLIFLGLVKTLQTDSEIEDRLESVLGRRTTETLPMVKCFIRILDFHKMKLKAR